MAFAVKRHGPQEIPEGLIPNDARGPALHFFGGCEEFIELFSTSEVISKEYLMRSIQLRQSEKESK